MTAAVSVGSTLQQFGASAAAAAQTVTAGGLQAVSHGAAAAATNMPQAASTVVSTGAVTTTQLATDLSYVEKPAKAIAAAAPRSSVFLRTAGFLSKALPVVTIGASALSGAKLVNDQGVQALATTKQGRGAVLGAVGGVLLLVPHPATQLAAAGVLGAVAVNHFGGMDRMDAIEFERARQRTASPSTPATASPS